MTESDTQTRILDAAEALYAEQGIDATSLRAITSAAGVNLAAVNYHFGSKRQLTEEVFARRFLPLSEERLRLLDAVEARATQDSRQLAVEEIVRAFIVPPLRLARDPVHGGERVIRLVGRLYSEPFDEVGAVIGKQFHETFHRFSVALSRALPTLPTTELLWRFHFMVGAMIHTVSDPARICRLTDGRCDTSDPDAIAERLIAFIAAGLAAPLPAMKEVLG
jgi:AcrR family transcriptional regulator